MLSGRRIMTRGEGDCNVVKSLNGSIQADFLTWKVKFLNRLKTLAKGEKKSCSGKCKTEGSCKNKRKERQEEEKKASPQNNSSEVRAGKLFLLKSSSKYSIIHIFGIQIFAFKYVWAYTVSAWQPDTPLTSSCHYHASVRFIIANLETLYQRLAAFLGAVFNCHWTFLPVLLKGTSTQTEKRRHPLASVILSEWLF